MNSESRGPVLASPGLLIGGRYELRANVGAGAMAQVWSATDQVLNRVVAVKILHQHLLSDPASVERFRREAYAIAALAHPNIVGVYDTVFDGAIQAIVMEYVDGVTLRQLLDERKTLAEPELVELLDGIAMALDHAHRNGIVHRDIKPANIL
ncbi:MAG TPA: protein kinase, partial [Microthrixaceae bacterium]|nr:protein kinase [Microthrixaceae bacterium]